MNILTEILSKSAVVLPPNKQLPEIPAWKAPSFWAQALSMAILLMSAAGIDLLGIFSAMGLGDSPEEIIANSERAVSAFQILTGMGLGMWGYVERQAPNFRLRFWKKKAR